MAVDGSNNVIVTGYSIGSGTLGRLCDDQVFERGRAALDQPLQRAGNGDDYARAVAVDGSNNVIVTGYRWQRSDYDYATIKYSSAGVPLWTNRYNGPGNGDDEPTAVAVDGSNNVIVTGYSIGSGGYYDYATIKYSSAGVPLWTNRYNGPGNGDDRATAMAVDGSNNVIVTGYSTGSGSGYDYATIEYSSAGVPLWTNRYNGPGNGDDEANAVAVDRGGNVFVTGSSLGSRSGNDFATLKCFCAPTPVLTASDRPTARSNCGWTGCCNPARW